MIETAPVDPLSQALRSLPMSGCLIARTELSAPWGIGLEEYGAAVFHVVLSGSCWLDADQRRRMRLRPGDIAVLMHGQAHELRSDLHVGTVQLSDLLRHCAPNRFPTVRLDGGGDRAAMLCGYFNFDRQTSHPLLRALPDVLHVNAFGDTAALDGLVAMADAESAPPRPGSGALTDLLCGLLLIQTLRAQLDVDSRAAVPWINGLTDPRIGAGLGLIHRSPESPWTVASLATELAMSRSSFARRFAECVGESPMRYLARCRVLRAAQILGSEQVSATEAMQRVGYQSESSFSRAFQRWLGCTPASYRRSFNREVSVKPREPAAKAV